MTKDEFRYYVKDTAECLVFEPGVFYIAGHQLSPHWAAQRGREVAGFDPALAKKLQAFVEAHNNIVEYCRDRMKG